MSRLFTLGCSYTQYSFPTWADWLATHYSYFENLGKSGMGNRGIFNRLCELIYKRDLNSKDTVVIAWSTPIREDRYFVTEGWKCLGNIYNQPFYSADWVKSYFDPFMGLMETINYVNASLHMLKNIGCNFIFTWLVLPTNKHINIESITKSSYLELCDESGRLNNYVDKILTDEKICKIDIESFVKEYDFHNKVKSIKSEFSFPGYDQHPKPISSYYYVKEILSPLININNFDIDNKILPCALDWQSYLENFVNLKSKPKWPVKVIETNDFF